MKKDINKKDAHIYRQFRFMGYLALLGIVIAFIKTIFSQGKSLPL